MKIVSSSSYLSVDQMGDGKVRTSCTSRAVHALAPWNNSTHTYSISQLYAGTNPLSKLEIASAINFFNYGMYSMWYNSSLCLPKYNLKLYLGTVQSLGYLWNYDANSGLKTELQDMQKSGSWRGCF